MFVCVGDERRVLGGGILCGEREREKERERWSSRSWEHDVRLLNADSCRSFISSAVDVRDIFVWSIACQKRIDVRHHQCDTKIRVSLCVRFVRKEFACQKVLMPMWNGHDMPRDLANVILRIGNA